MVATSWVARLAEVDPDFRGAFFTGSATALPEDSVLPPWSDVDVAVVVSGQPAPAKLGKFAYHGVLLEVTYLAEAELATPSTVAATYYLAPSFRGGQTIADPTGHLRRLSDVIAPRFAHPDSVRDRCDDVLGRIAARLSAFDPTAPWPQAVTAWMFPTSLTTQVVLVAALRPPTVRLRYLAARSALGRSDTSALYPTLLRQLGCDGCDRATVQAHLDRLADVFDRTAEVSRTPFSFSGDITAAARPIAIAGSQELIDNGDHREAVFWIIATYARCVQILAVDGPDELCHEADLQFQAAVTDLTGIRDQRDLTARRAATVDLLPTLRASATAITAETLARTPS